MQDRFTKWLEVVPLRKPTAANVTKAFTERIAYRHGCPEYLISDNGTQLKSSQLQRCLKNFGIQHRTTPPYTLQCNPIERTNQTVKTMLAQYVGKNHKTWDEHLAVLQYAFNTARHEAIGYSPAFLNHGRELTRPHPEDRRPRVNQAAPDTAHRRLQDAYVLVRIHLARAFHQQEKYYNLRRRDWRPKIGEKVWKRDHALSDKSKAFKRMPESRPNSDG